MNKERTLHPRQLLIRTFLNDKLEVLGNMAKIYELLNPELRTI